MNIFFLSTNPEAAAQAHGDRHVVKMLLESVQLLWTAQHIGHSEADSRADLSTAPTTKSGQPGYKPTHRNHPCAIWTRATIGNYRWLCALAAALAVEYHHRYPTAGEHACEPHVRWLTENPPPLPQKSMTMPPCAMPVEYKISRNAVVCYRAFYAGSKQERGITVYTRRERPIWL